MPVLYESEAIAGSESGENEMTRRGLLTGAIGLIGVFGRGKDLKAVINDPRKDFSVFKPVCLPLNFVDQKYCQFGTQTTPCLACGKYGYPEGEFK